MNRSSTTYIAILELLPANYRLISMQEADSPLLQGCATSYGNMRGCGAGAGAGFVRLRAEGEAPGTGYAIEHIYMSLTTPPCSKYHPCDNHPINCTPTLAQSQYP
eukprot:763062-Hanusia_phi.AAC.6